MRPETDEARSDDQMFEECFGTAVRSPRLTLEFDPEHGPNPVSDGEDEPAEVEEEPTPEGGPRDRGDEA